MNHPSSWIMTEFDNVLNSIVGGGTPSKSNTSFFKGDIPWMSVKDMNKDVLVDTVDHITQEAVTNSSTNVIPSGIPIIATRMSLGKIVVANFDAAINQDLKALFHSSQISRNYLIFWYRSIAHTIEALGTGTTVKGIRLEVLKALRFPLSSLAEQKEIANKLDTLLAQVDCIKSRLDAIPDIIKRFRQSVLAAAVSGKLTEEWRERNAELPSNKEILDGILISRRCKWEEEQLKAFERKGTLPQNENWKNKYKNPINGYLDEYDTTTIKSVPKKWLVGNLDTVSILVTGKTPSTTDEKNWNGEIPFLSPTQIKPEGIILAPDRFVSNKGASKTPILPKDSILIVCIGTIGKVGFLNENAAFNQQLNALIPVEGMDSRFLFYWSKTLHEWLNKTSSAVVNAAIINKSRLSLAPCPIPSYEEQKQIVKRVEQLIDLADQIEQRVKDAQLRVNNLTQSILAKAFRGELTAEWRELNQALITGENSAEALLKKIKLEREKLKPVKKIKTTKKRMKKTC